MSMTLVGLGADSGTWDTRICWNGRVVYEAGSEEEDMMMIVRG
jgi:Txe/YoeB family toxin of Txe-Axe toxin-antitoxin module